MKIAIFSDIHGNISALEAVMKNLENEDIDKIYCLGDLVGYGPYPNEVIDLIKENDIETVMGNYDQGVGFNLDDCGCAYKTEKKRVLGDRSLEWTKNEVTDENKEFLKKLNENIKFEVEDKNVLLVHGSPRKINQYLFYNHPDSSIKRMMEQYEADIMVTGHTHLPYVKKIDDKLVINDGSVGKQKPYHKNQELFSTEAKYIILNIEKDSVSTEIRSNRYDYEKIAQDINNSELPDEFAEIIRGRNK
ncbi:MAG: metallophosphatase family protein [Halanaerobiales bacterium]|nr:metallophosphatase family protein [Halanaerobiales bacterium]